MFEMSDPAITLFGKKISLPVAGDNSTAAGRQSENMESSCLHEKKQNEEEKEEDQQQTQQDKDTTMTPTDESKEEDQVAPTLEESTEPAKSSMDSDNCRTPPAESENTTPKSEEDQNETNGSKEKAPKKPDKILPCPRCNSLDTKFCYYNNYNVNQPRHFCKNCQRYWTAGGTMRNVPVGAGRRKNKNSSSHYRHITVSEALQTAQTEMPEVLRRAPMRPNGTVLSFGSDAPLCESMASVLNIAEKTMRNCHVNGFHRTNEQMIPAPCGGGSENGEELSSGSSVTVANSTEEGNQTSLPEPAIKNCQPFPPQVPYFLGVPWNYPWNSTQWGPPTPIAPPPAVCSSNFPVSFYAAPAYWGCTVPGAWSIPWVSPPSSSSQNSGSSGSGPHSPTLGKHSREGNILNQSDSSEKEVILKQNNSERCLWVPKTLRIDDPGEAARSSIWATLGIKNDRSDASKGRGLFGDLQSKTKDKNHDIAEKSPVLQANPAALSRSLTFHESS